MQFGADAVAHIPEIYSWLSNAVMYIWGNKGASLPKFFRMTALVLALRLWSTGYRHYF